MCNRVIVLRLNQGDWPMLFFGKVTLPGSVRSVTRRNLGGTDRERA